MPLARGEKLGCFALTEPNAGSDAANQQTRAVREGDHYRISGQKVFITCGQAADVCLLFAMTDPEKKARGISAFLVDAETPGFDRSRHQVKLGVNASGTVEIFLTDVRVPAGTGSGRRATDSRSRWRPSTAGGSASRPRRSASRARPSRRRVAYSKQRHAFGKTIAEFQVIRFYLADMATDLDAARLLTRRAAAAKDAAEAEGGRLRPRGRHREALRRRDGPARDDPGAPDPWRIRLHEGVPGRAELSRRAHHRDLRGDQRDPPADHRPRDLQGSATIG